MCPGVGGAYRQILFYGIPNLTGMTRSPVCCPSGFIFPELGQLSSLEQSKGPTGELHPALGEYFHA